MTREVELPEPEPVDDPDRPLFPPPAGGSRLAGRPEPSGRGPRGAQPPPGPAPPPPGASPPADRAGDAATGSRPGTPPSRVGVAVVAADPVRETERVSLTGGLIGLGATLVALAATVGASGQHRLLGVTLAAVGIALALGLASAVLLTAVTQRPAARGGLAAPVCLRPVVRIPVRSLDGERAEWRLVDAGRRDPVPVVGATVRAPVARLRRGGRTGVLELLAGPDGPVVRVVRPTSPPAARLGVWTAWTGWAASVAAVVVVTARVAGVLQ